MKEDDKQQFENALYSIFCLPQETAASIFDRLQVAKKTYREYESNQDSFYNSTQATDELTQHRSNQIAPRPPVAFDSIIPRLSQAVRVESKSEKSNIFKNSRSKFMTNPNVFETTVKDMNDFLTECLRYGEVLNVLTLKNNVYVQFLAFESCLALTHFQKLEGNYLFFKKEDENAKSTTVQEFGYVVLSGLPAELLGDALLEQKYIHKMFLKGAFFNVEQSKCLLQFSNIGSAIKFLKMNEYEGSCKAELAKSVNLDEWQQIRWE
ncbi:Conserved_hypothetical protein [Hexamita inflata]|uniref:Uncharacterized protein n=1 Tax=Hexamita inflata TaxID=28002 RepID=A0AA86TSH7_9EUKA|nr:Conserved hypothetical protein [Hexamita inflata]